MLIEQWIGESLMAAMSESTARLILERYAKGERHPLTMWEQAQLAWIWLKHFGHAVPEVIDTPDSASQTQMGD